MFLTCFNDRIIKWVNVVIVLAMVFLVACIALQISNRFLFKIPMPWTEEFAKYFFVWLAMFGSAKALRKKSHISVDVLEVLLKGRAATMCALVTDAVCLIFAAALLYVSIPWTWKNFGVATESVPALSMGLFCLCIPLAAALMVLFGIEVFILRLKSRMG